mgnify:CR=1 FL=1
MSENFIQIGAAGRADSPARAPRPEASLRRPEWLRIRLQTPAKYHEVRKLVDGLNLNTVCKEAKCPNIYECWGEHGTATFMILGEICTRRCGFCAVRPRVVPWNMLWRLSTSSRSVPESAAAETAVPAAAAVANSAGYCCRAAGLRSNRWRRYSDGNNACRQSACLRHRSWC